MFAWTAGNGPPKHATSNLGTGTAGGAACVKVRGEAGDPGTRITGELQLGAINVNLRMVDDGYAWKHPKDACGGAYEDAESAARTAGRGLWQTGSPVPPWEFKLR